MKQNIFTVVMYHYVRDLQHSRYPQIKGLDAHLFEQQIEYFQKHYTFISMDMAIDAFEGKCELPEKSLLLTFDDGYIDHYTIVFPILKNRGIPGAFFAPVKAITEHKVLDVNKIHFILAATKETSALLAMIKTMLVREKASHTYDYYYNKLAVANRYDSPEVIFVKRLLQNELDVTLRGKIVDELFLETTGLDESSFSRELYMNTEQLRLMAHNQMHIGSHGYDHFWLSSLTKEQQAMEVERSVSFLKTVYGQAWNDRWTICYPYGDFNEETLSLLPNYGCKLGFTTKVDVANTSTDNQFTIARFDTNDFPKQSNAVPNELWVRG